MSDVHGKKISLAIETTSRVGGMALGIGGERVETLDFDAARRAAAQAVGFMDQLLVGRGLRPDQVDDLYVSVGPGSFTGTRVGVTVARAFAQAVAGVRCVAVFTPRAVVEALDGRAGDRAAVVLDARRGNFHISPFVRGPAGWQGDGDSVVTTLAEYEAGLSGPVTVLGEGLGYGEFASAGVTVADEALWLPRVEQVWSVGRAMAEAGQFIDYHMLLPIYTGRPFITKKAT